MLAFPPTLTPGLEKNELHKVSRYGEFGYGEWTFGSGLPVVERLDLFPQGYVRPGNLEKERLIRFFSFSDIHITDKEAPNQLILFQQIDPASYRNTSIYSPVMLYTTQVLDAAVQTVNDLHRRDPFDFGLMLGDASNDPMYNEIRWFIDVLDGKVITPSSGASGRGQCRLSDAVPGGRTGQGHSLVHGSWEPRLPVHRILPVRCGTVVGTQGVVHGRQRLGCWIPDSDGGFRTFSARV